MGAQYPYRGSPVNESTHVVYQQVVYGVGPSRCHIKKANFIAFFIWSGWRDLNSRPHGPQPYALPTALHPDTEHDYTLNIMLLRP
jgi:hypothetical protein